MRFQIDRTTIIFIIFLVILGIIFGANQFVQNQPPLEITVAVDPLAEDWVQAAAQAYNGSNPLIANGTTRVQVKIVVADDLDVWRGNPAWNSSNHPEAWIASSSISIDYLPPNLPFRTLHGSLARTPLVWGGFANRVTWITDSGTRPFDWASVQEIAVAQSWANVGVTNDPSYVNMAIIWPSSSMAGVGALMTAAADYSQTTALSTDVTGDSSFVAWFSPINDSLQNSQRIGGNPAETMASRGSSAADFALLPELQWLLTVDNLTKNGDFAFSYPAYQFFLDFPMARWEDSQMTDNQLAAVASFGEFLAAESGQTLAIAHGLRPANREPDASATLFTNAQAQGIQLTPDYGHLIEKPISHGLADWLIGLVE
jgi:hypothetical protein